MNKDINAANAKAARIAAVWKEREAERAAARAKKNRIIAASANAAARLSDMIHTVGLGGAAFAYSSDKDNTVEVEWVPSQMTVATFHVRHNDDASEVWLEMDGQRLTDQEALAVAVNAIPE